MAIERSRAQLPLLAAALGALAMALAQAPAVGGGAFEVLHSVPLPAAPMDGIVPNELSGLAWDADEQLMYAVSDKGGLFHYRLKFSGDRIEQVTPVYGVRLAPGKLNAEGLALINAGNGARGDSELLIAVENGPRLRRYTPRGEALGEVALPLPLRNVEDFRGRNNGLESVAVHPRHGVVLAPQQSLRSRPAHLHTLYATDGSTWSFDRMPGGEIKAIEAVSDGTFVVLERPRNGGTLLRRVDPASCSVDATCPVSDLLLLDAADNYEGLARLADDRFLIVSDNGKDRQRPTLLVLLGRRR